MVWGKKIFFLRHIAQPESVLSWTTFVSPHLILDPQFGLLSFDFPSMFEMRKNNRKLKEALAKCVDT